MKLEKRKAGVLLHPTSLPGGIKNGDLGLGAYQFIDFISDCGFKLWQILPLGPTHEDNSPYQCLSAHAGDAKLISVDKLLESSWVNVVAFNNDANVDKNQRDVIEYLLGQFDQFSDSHEKQALTEFQENHKVWLQDFSLFIALKEEFNDTSWVSWPLVLRDRNDTALHEAKMKHAKKIRVIEFEQFIFFQQWLALKHYANSKNIELFGDIPLFVAHDSSDVWANRSMFKLRDDGYSDVIAGVPPDYFSETGQRWGNPLYDWQAIAKNNYQWWIDRLATQFEMFDLLRVDHFRGLEAYWEIPEKYDTAMNGYWVKGPGDAFFDAIEKYFGNNICLVAEDLGFITEEVHALRLRAKLPGMKILQFAFDSDSSNPYLLHNHEEQSVVYTGTHDNDTTLGWYQNLSDESKANVYQHFKEPQEKMPWLLIENAFASVSKLAIIPMQDLMSLGSEHRMNVPGTTDGNWQWRFQWSDVDKDFIGEKTRQYMQRYDR